MSNFTNTVEVVGDEALTDSIIDRSITEIADNISTSVGQYAFRSCKALTEVNFPNVTKVNQAAFYECTALKKADFGTYVQFANNTFYGCKALEALILRSTAFCTFVYGCLTNSAIQSGTGYMYVPAALVEEYKAAQGWSSYASQIRAIEDYPEVCDPYTWEAVFKAIDAGTYADTYKVGDLVPLDLGDEGIVNMQIAGIDVDDKADGSGKAPISWISKELLATRHRWNPALESNYVLQEIDAWKYVASNGNWVSQNQHAVSDVEATWTITAEEAGTLSIKYLTWGNNTTLNTLYLTVNGEVIESGFASQISKTHTVSVSAGDVVTVYAKHSNLVAGQYYTAINFSGTGAIDVDADYGTTQGGVADGHKEGTGSIGGWEKSEMRSYMQETIKPLIPETVRGRLVSVSKTHAAYNTSGSLISQTTSDDVWLPTRGEVTDSSGKYASLFPNNTSRKKYKNTAIADWWMRDANSSANVYYVGTGGSYGMTSAGSSKYFALCFCT